MSYFHASGNPISVHHLEPNGYYERVGPNGSCPESIDYGSGFVGFPISSVGEVSFSKSPEAAALATIKDADPENAVVWLYMTDDEPEIDLSNCFFDFSALEEVRFRHKVPISFYKSIKIPAKIVRQVQTIYENLQDAPGELYIPLKGPKRAIRRLLEGRAGATRKLPKVRGVEPIFRRPHDSCRVKSYQRRSV